VDNLWKSGDWLGMNGDKSGDKTGLGLGKTEEKPRSRNQGKHLFFMDLD
jgi:hypothetical protein